MRCNTGATYEHKKSETRSGEKSCPFQKQGFIIGQIKYIFAENIRVGPLLEKALELTGVKSSRQILFMLLRELNHCISLSI